MTESNEYVTQAEFNVFRRMSWFRVIFGIAVAVVVTLLIVGSTIRDNNVAGCMRSSERANANANNWEVAAQVREDSGDSKVAQKYRANAAAIRLSIPMTKGWKGKPTDRGKNPQDRRDGCKHAYPPVLPFQG